MKTLITTALFALASLASAQYGDYERSSAGNPSSGSGSGSPSPSGNPSFPGFNINKLDTIRLAHGVMASLAFVIFFPVGAISIRIIPGRFALIVHMAFQMLAYALFICVLSLGIWMVTQIKFGSSNLLDSSSTNYHPIIGIVVFVFLSFQPVSGFIHHRLFKRYQRRQTASYAHLWLGRIVITLGIINGGLGLRLSNNTRKGEIAYGVVAGVIWLVWMAAALLGEIRRGRRHATVEVSPPNDGKNGGHYA